MGSILKLRKSVKMKNTDSEVSTLENRLKAHFTKHGFEPMSKLEIKNARMNAYSPIV
jgi:hypothetical protein